jgi:hypothetical protein
MVGTWGTSCCTAPATPAAVSLTLGEVGTGTEIGAAPAVAGGLGELETGFAGGVDVGACEAGGESVWRGLAGAVGAGLGRCGARAFAAACECLGMTLAVGSRRAVCFATTPLGASTLTLGRRVVRPQPCSLSFAGPPNG